MSEEENSIDEKLAVHCENLVKIYKKSDIEVLALQGLDLTIERGEVMAVIGNSGSGKSTLMNMIGGLDRPSAGKLHVCGKNLFKMSEADLNIYKQSTVGFVWQNNARNLLPYLTAAENVMMPMQFRKAEEKRRKREDAMALLELVGIGHRAKSRLSQLSGGEQQRVAIAIALANKPEILLADEPTGSVDVATSAFLLEVFREVNRSLGTTIIIVTHDRQVAKKVSRVVTIRDGKTSAEMIAVPRANLGDFGFGAAQEESHEEFAVLDRAGRVQIPSEALAALGVKGNKVRMNMEDGRLIITAMEERVKEKA